jgi:hypothetical protein
MKRQWQEVAAVARAAVALAKPVTVNPAAAEPAQEAKAAITLTTEPTVAMVTAVTVELAGAGAQER